MVSYRSSFSSSSLFSFNWNELMLIYKLEIKRPGNFRWKSHDNFLSLKKTKGQFMYGQELSLCFQRDQDIYIRIFNLPRSLSLFLSFYLISLTMLLAFFLIHFSLFCMVCGCLNKVHLRDSMNGSSFRVFNSSWHIHIHHT